MNESVTGTLAAILLPLAVAATTSSVSEPAARFALVVGNNLPLANSDYETLRYADDDALRFAEFMTDLGAEVELFTTPDAESAARFGDFAATAKPPRRQDIVAGIERLQDKLQQAEGRTRDLYVYFSGHGSVSSSKAYLHVLDGEFSRTDLKSLVLDRLSAEHVHVIVDSCHAYFMVNPRGERVKVIDDDVSLTRYPKAGFILSTSAQKEVQEWAGYEAGVFSYQLLGAMQGAADVDLDGKVTYGEAHAYIVAANSGIENVSARVQPFVWRPVVGDRVLIQLEPSAQRSAVNIPEDVSGHLFVVDGQGHRVLDAHNAPGQPLSLLLRPQDSLSLWRDGRPLARVSESIPHQLVAYENLEFESEVASRGAVTDEFRKNLFKRPLTREYVAGLNAVVGFQPQAVAPVRKHANWHPVSIGLVSGGAVAVIGGLAAGAVFVEARRAANPDVFTPAGAPAVAAARSRAETARTVMVSTLISGAIMVSAGLLYELLDGGPSSGDDASP